MADIKLDNNGDIEITDKGDISLTESVCQAVKLRLAWIHEEWRLGPELGFMWFEHVFVKNPNIDNIEQLIRDEVLQVEGVTSAEVNQTVFHKEERKIQFLCTFTAGEEEYSEEVTINA